MRHRALFDTVVGERAHVLFSPAELPGYSVEAVREGPFPTLTPKDGETAAGVLAEGISEVGLARLEFYERAFGYDLKDVVLADGRPARVYMAQSGLWTPDGTWSLGQWAADWGQVSVIAAREVMGYMGEKPPGDIAQMFPMIRARAWSAVNAEQVQHPQDTFRGRVDVAERRRVYAQYFALDEFDLSHERFDGSMTPHLMRAVFMAADAAHVLPYDPVRDRVLVVEQMRLGPLARGDARLWQLEPIAGRLDPGETPQEAVRREAVEETGLSVGALHAVGETYSSPGNSTEFHYTYVGIADLPDDASGVGGLDAEDEDIRSHVMDFDALLARCDARQIVNAPLVLITYWLARHRDRLRASS